MLLTRATICQRLGCRTWKTAHKRLTALNLTPRKLGKEVYLLEEDLERAIAGKNTQPVEPNFEVLHNRRKSAR